MAVCSKIHVPQCFSMNTMLFRSIHVVLCIRLVLVASNCWVIPQDEQLSCFLYPSPRGEQPGCLHLRGHRQPLDNPHTCSCRPCENFQVLGYTCLSFGYVVRDSALEDNTPQYPNTLCIPANTWSFPALLIFQWNRCKTISHFVNLHLGDHQ